MIEMHTEIVFSMQETTSIMQSEYLDEKEQAEKAELAQLAEQTLKV